jgi:hypothetical protein
MARDTRVVLLDCKCYNRADCLPPCVPRLSVILRCVASCLDETNAGVAVSNDNDSNNSNKSNGLHRGSPRGSLVEIMARQQSFAETRGPRPTASAAHAQAFVPQPCIFANSRSLR